jgi:hypothetical protein
MFTIHNHTLCWECAVSETFCASDGTMPCSFHMHRIRCLSLFMFSLASSQGRSPSARRFLGLYRGFVFGFCVIPFFLAFCQSSADLDPFPGLGKGTGFGSVSRSLMA